MSHPSNPFYFDGDYGTPVLQSRSPREYPFRRLGDITTAVFPEVYAVDINKFTPLAGGTAHPTESGFYLLTESQPEIYQGKIATFTRVYSTVPTQQTDYSTLSLTKPAVSSLGTSGGGLVNNNNTINYGEPFEYLGYLWGNNQVYGPRATVTAALSGSDTRVTWTAHGLAGTETIATRQASLARLFTAGQYAVIDPDTIDLLGLSVATTNHAWKYYRDYIPGTDRVRCKVLSDFDLDPLNLPVPSPLLNDAEFLAAVIANPTGWVDYDARDLTPWRDSAIYQLDRIQIDMSNV